ncbi:MAG: hypothetical protein J5517_11200 [Eubacterium sp.]|nr:hypothetical protein [Eubacterium sp.]
MENFEKVEKLVEKANVSYEDAKNALDQANGDLLDAMILLEKQGKAKKPEQSVYRTSPEADTRYKDVPAVIENSKKEDAKTVWRKICDGVKKAARYTVDNSLCVTRKGETVLKLPLWISIILLLCAWHLLLIVMLVSLFLECRYTIEGKNEAKEFNDMFSQAADLADKARESFTSDESAAPAASAAESVAETVENVSETVASAVENVVEGTVEASDVQSEDKAE